MAKTPDNNQLWQFTRGKIEHEDQWIQQRVSWNLASTSFLLAAYTVLLLIDQPLHSALWLRRFLLATIPLLGAGSSVFVIAGLWAAWIAETKAITEWDRLASDIDSKARFPELHSQGLTLALGKIASWGTSISALLAWLAILAATWFVPLVQPFHNWR